MNKPIIYTVGHSTHTIDYFIELITAVGVNCIVDVRSLPASRFNPQYNKKALTASLHRFGIAYLHMGDAFGARQTDPALLDNGGRVDFKKVRGTFKFSQGVNRLVKAAGEGHTIALMCSEAEPLHCHRFAMISTALKDFEVRHILKDKTILSQSQLEQKLVTQLAKKLPPDLFQSKIFREQQLDMAYDMLNKSIAYSPKVAGRAVK